MTSKTTIQVTQEVRDLLEAKKEGNESINDVLRREMGISVDDEVADLTAYLSDETAEVVQSIIDLIESIVDVTTIYDANGDNDRPRMEFRHPESEMPVAAIETSDWDGYTVTYRASNGQMIEETTPENLSELDEQTTERIARRVRGAYRKYS